MERKRKSSIQEASQIDKLSVRYFFFSSFQLCECSSITTTCMHGDGVSELTCHAASDDQSHHACVTSYNGKNSRLLKEPSVERLACVCMQCNAFPIPRIRNGASKCQTGSNSKVHVPHRMISMHSDKEDHVAETFPLDEHFLRLDKRGLFHSPKIRYLQATSSVTSQNLRTVQRNMVGL